MQGDFYNFVGGPKFSAATPAFIAEILFTMISNAESRVLLFIQLARTQAHPPSHPSCQVTHP